MVRTAKGRGGSTPERYAKRTSVRSANKYHSQLSPTLVSSNKRTSVSSTNKQQSHILFISEIKTRTKHTMSSTIRRKRQITPVLVGEQPSHSQAQGVPSLICHGVILLLPFLWENLRKRIFLNIITIKSFSCQILRLYVIFEWVR